MTSCSSCYPSARLKCTKSQFNEVPQPHALLAKCLIRKIKIKTPIWQLYNAFLCSLSLTNLLQASHKGTVARKGSLSPVPGNQKDCLRVLRRWLRTALWEFWFPSQYSTVHHWPYVTGRKAFILCATDRRQDPRKCTVLPGSLVLQKFDWISIIQLLIQQFLLYSQRHLFAFTGISLIYQLDVQWDEFWLKILCCFIIRKWSQGELWQPECMVKGASGSWVFK